MARLQAALLALALSSASATEGFAGSDELREALPSPLGCISVTDREKCCKSIDSRDSLDGFNPTATEKYCVPSKSDGGFTSSGGNHVCEPACAVNGKGCAAADADEQTKKSWAGSDQTANIYSCWIQTTVAATTAAATAAPATTEPTTTTTYTPWDSSASSSDSDTLDSSYSSSFKEYQESSKSSAENSQESSGSDASGSGGSYMHLWQWGLILGALAVCCCALCAAMMPKPKPKKPKAKKVPAPAPDPLPEEPMPELAPLMPVTTSYVQQPVMTTAYPMTYAQPAPAAYVV